MKKIVLVLVCSIVIIVFIALNYLLWERENNIKSFESLSNLNANKSANIDTLQKEIKNLGEVNVDSKKTISQLEENIKSLQDSNSKAALEKQKLSDELSNKVDLIFVLKQQADFKLLEEVIKKWLESIDSGQYETAFSLQSNIVQQKDQNPSLDAFTKKFKNSVKSIKLKSIKLYSDESTDKKKSDIVFDVVFDVKKSSNEALGEFVEGQNQRYFAFAYNKLKKDWEISNILVSY